MHEFPHLRALAQEHSSRTEQTAAGPLPLSFFVILIGFRRFFQTCKLFMYFWAHFCILDLNVSSIRPQRWETSDPSKKVAGHARLRFMICHTTGQGIFKTSTSTTSSMNFSN